MLSASAVKDNSFFRRVKEGFSQLVSNCSMMIRVAKPCEATPRWLGPLPEQLIMATQQNVGKLSTRIKDAGIAIRHLRERTLFYTAGSRNEFGRCGHPQNHEKHQQALKSRSDPKVKSSKMGSSITPRQFL